MLDSSRAQHNSTSWRKRAFKIPNAAAGRNQMADETSLPNAKKSQAKNLFPGVTSYSFALNVACPLQQLDGALPVIWRAQAVALALTAPLPRRPRSHRGPVDTCPVAGAHSPRRAGYRAGLCASRGGYRPGRGHTRLRHHLPDSRRGASPRSHGAGRTSRPAVRGRRCGMRCRRLAHSAGSDGIGFSPMRRSIT